MKINIERWIIDLLNEIDVAAYNNKSFNLSLTPKDVIDIATAWRDITNVELS